jgi:hypothetical protein
MTERRPRGFSLGSALPVIVVVAAMVLVLVVVVPAMRIPPHISTLTVENGNVYQVVVTASDGTGGSVVVGTVRRESTSSFAELPDLGDLWVFAFSYAGVEAGTLRMSRAELVAAAWRVVVPADVGRRLRDAGMEPSHR